MSDRIIIADDHPLFRDGLCRLVQRLLPDGNIDEAACAAELDALLATPPAPHLMLLDLLFPGFPGFDGADSVRRLRQRLPLGAIVVISMLEGDAVADAAMAAGANAFINKSVAPAAMSAGIAAVLAGDSVVMPWPELAASSAHSTPAAPPPNLSPAAGASPTLAALTCRQREILRHVAHGLSNKEIARQLDISPYTVRIHVSTILHTLGVPTRAAAAATAVAGGLA